MRNLLEETLECLEENGVELADVRWVGCREFQIPISEFLKKADAEYDPDVGVWYGLTAYPPPDFYCADGERRTR